MSAVWFVCGFHGLFSLVYDSVLQVIRFICWPFSVFSFASRLFFIGFSDDSPVFDLKGESAGVGEHFQDLTHTG